MRVRYPMMPILQAAGMNKRWAVLAVVGYLAGTPEAVTPKGLTRKEKT